MLSFILTYRSYGMSKGRRTKDTPHSVGRYECVHDEYVMLISGFRLGHV